MHNLSPKQNVYKSELCWWQVIETRFNLALLKKHLVNWYLTRKVQTWPQIWLHLFFPEFLQVLIWGKKKIIFLPAVVCIFKSQNILDLHVYFLDQLLWLRGWGHLIGQACVIWPRLWLESMGRVPWLAAPPESNGISSATFPKKKRGAVTIRRE